jgi:hypothetical protein
MGEASETLNKGFPRGNCQTNTDFKMRLLPNDTSRRMVQGQNVRAKVNKTKAVLPIGRTARLACQIEAMRSDCCKAAEVLANQKTLNEDELDECARLDDALAKAHALLKATLAGIIMSRLKRRSRASSSES